MCSMGVAGAAAWAFHAAGSAQLRAPYSYDRRTPADLRLPSFNGHYLQRQSDREVPIDVEIDRAALLTLSP